jgi:drug/metabolite transporter (DMT)-like permease
MEKRSHMRICDRRSQLLAFGGLLAVSLLWGSSFVVIKVAATRFEAVNIASYRATIAALCLSGLVVIKREKFPRDIRTISILFFLSIFGQILPFISLGVSGHLTSSQNSAMMMGGVPLLTLLFSRFLLPDELWSLKKWLALVVGFAGVVVALGGTIQNTWSSGAHSNADLEGSLFALLAAVGYAIGAILSRIASRNLSPLVACAFTMTVSAGILWTYSFFSGSIQATASISAWTAIFFLGTANTAFAYGIYFWLIKFSGATFASTNNYMVPIIGMAMGFIMLSEKIYLGTLSGLMLTLIGIYLFSRTSRTS